MSSVIERPPSFDEEYDWNQWVLDNGLPDAPAVLEVGQVVPVARWAGPRFGAVLSVWWNVPGDVDDEDEQPFIDSEVEIYRRGDQGWEAAGGSGGSSWIDPPFQRPIIEAKHAEVWFEQTAGGGEWLSSALAGVAGRDVAAVEVRNSDGATARNIESPFGAFVVAVDARAPATILFKTVTGETAVTERFEGHPDWV
jgi:hypothetical protein